MITETWPSLVVNLELKTKLLSHKAKGTENVDRNSIGEQKEKRKKITVNTSVPTT